VTAVFIKVSESPTGGTVWRPNLAGNLVNGVGGLAFLALLLWMLLDGGPLSMKQTILSVLGVVFLVVAVPPAVFRWRLVLERDELLLVFLTTRRLPLQEIVEARSDRGGGLVFICRDGSRESTSLLSNGLRSHRRANPTAADLAARAVLCAAAEARGEFPPRDFRLPPVRLSKKSVVRAGVFAFVLGLFLGE
jgi:hypothetical protein